MQIKKKTYGMYNRKWLNLFPSVRMCALRRRTTKKSAVCYPVPHDTTCLFYTSSKAFNTLLS